ncbi:DMT family transporter [Pseudomonas sp. 7P_10.2_Bac1]|uniref:DMT family transporter n=1 Tax=Pseudomonas sp. 7P_10.2_Bac1 TaxID=2971614 RepID=UPI0021CA48E9|nr:DMT family transporter [Pseudomonas sp. 7P_10.2_Bac1]MCU1728447.1 DMT family transporter [Pseudomonas sp. 7P_10.2_Bac1]
MPFFIAIALSLLAGAAVPMQAGSNARLGIVLGHPFWATVISLMVSGAAIAVVILLVKVPRPNLGALLDGPWWMWLGGLAGVFYITVALMTVPRLGALNFIMAVVVGQLIISLAIDYFGLLGLPKNTPSLQKLLGVSVVLAGFLIASRG